MMVSMEVRLGPGSPHWWWFATKRRMKEGSIDEKEVKAALGALIAEGRGCPEALSEDDLETVGEYWQEVANCLVEGELRPDTVIRKLEPLLKAVRHDSKFSQAKTNWSKKLALIKGGTHEGTP